MTDSAPVQSLPENRKHRGTIIVDACALFGLCLPVDRQLHPADSYAPKEYTDILLYLAKQGFDIVIPEMVSYEAGKILADGLSIGKFLGSGTENQATKSRRVFLKSVAHNEHPHISIVPTKGPANVLKFIEQIKTSIHSADGAVVHHSSKINNAYKGHFIKHQLKQAKSSLGGNLGDDAIMELVGDYNPSHPTSVFVLTEDRGLQARLGIQFPKCGVFNILGLMRGIVSNHLCDNIGLAQPANTAPFLDDMEHSYRQHVNSDYMKSLCLVDCQGHNIKTLKHSCSDHHLFNNLLRLLAHDLKEAEKTGASGEKPNGHASPSPTGRAEAFRRKFGGNYSFGGRVNTATNHSGVGI